jgi:hypothetical protein
MLHPFESWLAPLVRPPSIWVLGRHDRVDEKIIDTTAA